jgi:predicted phosphodiesterase
MMGDLGHYEKSILTMKHLDENKRSVSAIILAGDLAYSQGNHKVWDKWFDLLDQFPVFREVSLQVAAGNHDVDITEKSGEIFTAYENRFRMPAIQPAIRKPVKGGGSLTKFLSHVPYPLDYDYGNAYYAYTYGPSRHLILSSYSNFDPGSKQYTWLVDELEKVDRSITPWLIVIMHVPIYNTFEEHRHDVQHTKGREILEPLFVKYHVNIVVSGHVHAYMRTKNVAFGKVNDTGPVHIIAGDGGRQIDSPFLNAEPEEWVVTRDSTVFGYGTFEIYNSTIAEWRWIHTSNDESHDRNRVYGDNTTTFPRGGRDQVYIDNQYFLSQAQATFHG